MYRNPLPATALVLAALATAACDTAQTPAGLSAPDEARIAQRANAVEAGLSTLSAEHLRELAALRRLTAPFHQFDAAVEAGWSTELTPCMWDATEGAMGFHYANMDFLLDGTVDLLEPETLLYEPQRNGRMRFVGVEYLIPFSLLPADADAPELLGQHLHQNYEAGVWALHVWVGRHNPEGLFADWNPNVTCDWAD